MTRYEAKKYADYFRALADKLMAAKLALLDGGVKSYTIDGRSLTRFDLDGLTRELDDALNKAAMYDNIANGKSARKAVGVVPRDI